VALLRLGAEQPQKTSVAGLRGFRRDSPTRKTRAIQVQCPAAATTEAPAASNAREPEGAVKPLPPPGQGLP
jgi:hypothetical protein